MGQPYDHLLDAARKTFPQPPRVNGNAKRPGGPAMWVRGGRAGHAVVNTAVGIALGSSRRRGGCEAATKA